MTDLLVGPTVSTAGSFSITVHADNGAGSTFDQTYLITAILLFNTVLPVISGTAQVGNALTSTAGTWSGVAPITYTYQWKSDGSNIGGATASSYTLVLGDVGHMITVVVTATNAGGNASATSAAVGPIIAAVGGSTPDAPVISAASPASDTTPNFFIDLPSGNGAPNDAVAGDVLRVQSKLGAGSFVDYVVYTLTSGDITTDTINVTSVTPLVDGSYTFQARLERGGSPSAWSNTVAGFIDTTAPTLSSPVGTKTGFATATLSVSTNDGSGILYGVLTLNSTAPTKAQIKAGQNAVGAAAAYAFNQAVSSTGTQSKNATGLTSSTTYFAYFMQEDTATNQSNVAAASSFVTDATPAMAWDTGRVGANITLSGGNLTATLSAFTLYSNVFGNGSGKSSGKYYYEMTLVAMNPDGQCVGFGDASITTSEQGGANVGSMCWRFGSGNVLRAGIGLGTIQTAAAGDVLAIAVDFDAKLAWFRKKTGGTTGNWNNSGTADPATGVGGMNAMGGGIVAPLTGPFWPMATLEISADSYTANFGPTYTMTKPSGYSDWT